MDSLRFKFSSCSKRTYIFLQAKKKKKGDSFERKEALESKGRQRWVGLGGETEASSV